MPSNIVGAAFRKAQTRNIETIVNRIQNITSSNTTERNNVVLIKKEMAYAEGVNVLGKYSKLYHCICFKDCTIFHIAKLWQA